MSMEGVPQRLEVRVDLLVQRPGQEPEPLPGLDGRAGEDQAVDLLGPQRLHGRAHREVGLARPGRTDPEGDGVGA